MNKDVLEPRLDLMPPQRVIAEIGNGSLQSRTIAAGDMDGSPENSGRFDAGHLPQPARSLVDCLSGGLKGDEPGIACHLIGGTLPHDMAVRKIDDALTPFSLVHVVGRDQRGQTVARHVVNEIPEFAPGFSIDPGGGFVEQQQFWLVKNAGCECQPLLPAARKVSGELVRPPGQTHSRHHILHRLPAVAHPIDPGDEIEVLEHREILVEAEALGHVTDLTANAGRIRDDVQPETGSAAAVRRQQTAEHADRRRFAAAIGAEEAADLARGRLQIQAMHDFVRAKAFLQIAHIDDEVGHCPAPAPIGRTSIGWPALKRTA
jgi:hypothetical protein